MSTSPPSYDPLAHVRWPGGEAVVPFRRELICDVFPVAVVDLPDVTLRSGQQFTVSYTVHLDTE